VIKLRQKASTITQLDSKIDVASVLGELSFLLDEKVVLSKLGFYAERFAGNHEGKGRAGSAVRVTGGGSGPGRSPLLGDVRFRVVLSGVASDAADVADLICRLEDSAYFCNVIPSFSRNREINAGARLAKEKLQVSEFEISCYLANYHQQGGQFGRQSPQGPKLQ
jgi:hypothetical protein